MARQMFVLALIFIAVVGFVAAADEKSPAESTPSASGESPAASPTTDTAAAGSPGAAEGGDSATSSGASINLKVSATATAGAAAIAGFIAL
ncbi:hypothetical protein L6452_41729 [Arctium lappa]|uniref:Uncharacterized protein n=1 Tax=Arctium lappa TaxID=4217 RepID=A0ACB8XQB3_ARCLA|nr:hypothetical protein L6452_41729 [Arctium lappa]